MLAIRMQRTGRKKHAMYRVVVQESRVTPSSGKVIAYLGSYDPHTKVAALVKEKADFYLEHGAQPSDRVARLLQTEGVKLPNWVTAVTKKEGKLKNPEKLRKNQPAAPIVEEPATATEVVAETPAAEESVPAKAADVAADKSTPESEKPTKDSNDTDNASAKS